MRLVYDDQVPGGLSDVFALCPGELKRAENDARLVKWIEVAAFDLLVECLGFEYGEWEKEFIC